MTVAPVRLRHYGRTHQFDGCHVSTGSVLPSQGIKQGLHGPARSLESFGTGDLGPVLFYLRDAIPRILKGTQAPPGWEDELGAAIPGIRPAIEVSQVLKLADELRRRSQAELGLGSEVGEADSIDADVAEDVEVRLTQIRIPMLGSWSKQLYAELAEEASQELPHRQPVSGEVV